MTPTAHTARLPRFHVGLRPLLAAWPVAVWAGRPALGRALRRAGLLLTPEEVLPAPALQRAWANAWANAAPANQPYFKPMQSA